MLLNVGSGGGAAAAPSGGAGTIASEAPAEEAKKEEKEEGIVHPSPVMNYNDADMAGRSREGGIGRGHGFRFVRLDTSHSEPSKRPIYYSMATMY